MPPKDNPRDDKQDMSHPPRAWLVPLGQLGRPTTQRDFLLLAIAERLEVIAETLGANADDED